MTPDQHFDQIEAQAATIDIDDDLRTHHQIDRTKLVQDAECVCSCGAECPSYTAHLRDVVDHAELFERLTRKYGRPPEGFDPTGTITPEDGQP